MGNNNDLWEDTGHIKVQERKGVIVTLWPLRIKFELNM